MALSQEITAFVQTAVRLPEARLRRVDRAWEPLQPHRAVVAEVVRGDLGLLDQVRELREYVMAEARRSALPSARALLLQKVLENSGDQRRAQAFAALSAPFADILLPSTGGTPP
jgi:hypothetical protein